MKKLYLIGLQIMTGSFLAQAQTINFPDANFKAKLLSSRLNNFVAMDSADNSIRIDANFNDEIEESEALRVYGLRIAHTSLNNIEGIEYFKNLEYLKFEAPIYDYSVINLPSLPNFKRLKCSYLGRITNINFTGNLPKLAHIDCSSNEITSLDVNSLSGLKTLICNNNRLPNMNINGVSSLDTLICTYNSMDSLSLNNLSSLRLLDCSMNSLTNLHLDNLPELKHLKCEYNELPSLSINNLLSLKEVSCDYNNLSNLTVSNLPNLSSISCFKSKISNLVLNNLPSLNYLNCSENPMTSLNISNFPLLNWIICDRNKITNLTMENLPSLAKFNFYSHQVTNLDLSSFKSLVEVKCGSGLLKTLNLSGLTKLEYLECDLNSLENILLKDNINLKTISCGNNQLTSLDISDCDSLEYLNCGANMLSNLDLREKSKLRTLGIVGNQFTSLDVSSCINLNSMYVNNNKISTIYMKNGVDNSGYFSYYSSFANNPLTYICADSAELEALQAQLLRDTITGATLNSLCSATLDGALYPLTGNIRFDADNNGCTITDGIFPNSKLLLSNGIESGYAIADAQGNFSLNMQPDNYTITPILPTNYFICTPASASVTLPEDTLQSIFCITPNGIHHDVDITLVPITPARPGFSDATYKLVLTNKGNQIESGTVEFKYQDDYQDYMAATPTPSATESGIVRFDFSNLQLFDSKTYTITLRTNSPSDNPAVNAGDILYIVTNATIDNDEDASDNTHAIKQTVVGSIDPNDKTCLEGDIVTPDLVGDYVHYLIRFENTGTFAAENVVVTDYIDLSKFDISTLQLTSTSHSCRTTISQGNKVQFIFDNIQLPYTEPDKHGYVAFKIKTLSTLAIGDSLKNKADIYFDYNLPIATNTATSRIDNVSTGIKDKFTESGKMSVFPNPTNGKCVVNFSSSNSGDMHLKVMNVAGSILYEQIIAHNKNSQIQLDLTVPNGIYFISIGNASEQYMQKVVVAK